MFKAPGPIDATPPAANAKVTTSSYDAFDRTTKTIEPGNRVTLGIIRAGSHMQVPVTLGAQSG